MRYPPKDFVKKENICKERDGDKMFQVPEIGDKIKIFEDEFRKIAFGYVVRVEDESIVYVKKVKEVYTYDEIDYHLPKSRVKYVKK